MADIGYIGENTDLVLGQEFLTWLWFRSETGNVFRMESPEHNGEPFTVAMEQRIVVRGGEGENQENVERTFHEMAELYQKADAST